MLGNPKGTYSSKVDSGSESDGSGTESESDYSDDEEERPRQANLKHLTPVSLDPSNCPLPTSFPRLFWCSGVSLIHLVIERLIAIC